MNTSSSSPSSPLPPHLHPHPSHPSHPPTLPHHPSHSTHSLHSPALTSSSTSSLAAQDPSASTLALLTDQHRHSPHPDPPSSASASSSTTNIATANLTLSRSDLPGAEKTFFLPPFTPFTPFVPFTPFAVSSDQGSGGYFASTNSSHPSHSHTQLQQQFSPPPPVPSAPSSFSLTHPANASVSALTSSSSPSPSPAPSPVVVAGFTLPNQTPAAVEFSSFSASSPSYFPSPASSSTSSSCSTLSSTASMPPVTQLRPSTSSTMSTGHSWEPYPKTSTVPSLLSQRSGSASFPSSLSLPPVSAHMGGMQSPVSMRPPPVASSAAALATVNLKEIKGDAVSLLLERVLKNEKDAILLLDMRSSVSHALSSIKTAVSVSVPNMLLKRPMFSLDMVTAQLTTELEAETFSRWRDYGHIVLFDAQGGVPALGSPTLCMAQKFRKEGCAAELGYLHGGFNAFVLQHTALCCSDDEASLQGSQATAAASLVGTSSSAPNSASSSAAATPIPTRPMSLLSPPRHRLHLGSLPSMMTKPSTVGPMGCQTPMIENPNVNPLFESVRQAMGLNSNITEEIPVRLPMSFPVHVIQNRLPQWLLAAVDEIKGKGKLASYFQKVEILEQKRLALLMLPQAMRTGRTTNFSIGAGIEKGLKNRYNNIWPYDHTRVHIGDCDDGDDYINASFLRPPFSKKSYIATQGPLPSTFQDFWKMAWEQDSRVVVMLTREQEMGRIKCHQYWPNQQTSVMDLGILQLTFVSESQPEDGYGTIQVRRMKLSHRKYPEQGERMITQIQYTGWPDFGVPETPMQVLKVMELANEHNHTSSSSLAGPMIVHCSAGCGRTGAFCVIDSILTEMKVHPQSLMAESIRETLAAAGVSLETKPTTTTTLNKTAEAATVLVVDDPNMDAVFATVSALREQRLSMVQTQRQFVFCYEAIFWHLALEYTKDMPGNIMMIPPPPVHTPSLALPPGSVVSNPSLSMGNAPITTTNQEFSFFG